MWQQHLLCASCGILCRGTDELLSTGRRIRPSLRRSSNRCTKQKAENGRDRALIQYLNGQGVLMTPCRFCFGCYIDTLCGRTLRNRMSGAAARHFFFFWKRCGPCPPVLGSTYLSKSAPPSAGNSQRRRGRRWRKHRANVHLHSLPRIPRSPMPPAGGKTCGYTLQEGEKCG